jgi:hypothetical protein
MNNYDPEVSSLEHSTRLMQQLRACLEMIREKAKADPLEAGCLIQPAEDLANEIVATQSTLHALTERIQSPVEEPSLFR